MITLRILMDYIRQHSSGKVFKDYTDEHLLLTLAGRMVTNCLFYSVNAEGKLNGILIADNSERGCFFAQEMLTTEKGVLRELTKKALEFHNPQTIKAHRRGKLRVYDAAHFLKKLTGE